MISKLSKMVLVMGMVLFFILTIWFALAGISFGINGVVVSIAGLLALGLVGTVILIWILGAAESIFIRFALIFQALRRVRAETEKQEMAADFFQVAHPTAGAVAVDRSGRMIRLQPPAGPPPGAPAAKEPDPEPDEPDPEPLLPIINPLSRILIIGGMGDGKTTLLKWLADDRVNKGHVVIADSHAAPDTWPDFCQVAGIGRNYPEIEATINYICDELDSRYKQRAAGTRKKFDPITLIIDELFVLHQFLNMGPQFKSLLAESRKVDIGLIMAGQSDRANALGLSGNKDLIAGFEAVVYLDRDDAGRYVAEVKTGRHSKHCIHPGPYRGRGGTSGRGPSRSAWGGPGGGSWRDGPHSPHGPHHEKPGFRADSDGGTWGTSGDRGTMHIPMADIDATGKDAEIIDLYRRGNTVSSIRREVFGQKGGKYIKLIRGVLGRYGIA
jgi:hypothetical protein